MKYIYFFDEKSEEMEALKSKGLKEMKRVLGGKGAGLVEMTQIGLPVPPGFTITTETCMKYFEKHDFPEGLWSDVLQAMKKLEEKTGKVFGSDENPLLVSVRSGAPISMPGMMDTILNLGLTDKSVLGLAKQTSNDRFAWDAYRRLIQMFGDVVLGIKHDEFEEEIEHMKKKYGVEQDVELSVEALKELVARYKEVYKKHGFEFPQDPYKQLEMAIRAVFESWNNERAIVYRKINKMPDDMGTAVNIVTMVFGNMGDDSGTGVAFTRDPRTGEKHLYGEFLPNAQGEDVVAGIRTPHAINEYSKQDANRELPTMEEMMPEVYKQLQNVANILEEHYRDMQDIEFTIEKGKLYLLQTRTGKRTAMAAVRIAVEMKEEGVISKEEAVMRVTPENVDTLLHPQVDPAAKKEVIAKGLAASPGAAVGKVVFDPDEAVELAEQGEKVLLVRHETSPDDIHGMNAAQGILTARGGMTSHAAVVARAMGKPAVVGCEELIINMAEEYFIARGTKIRKGDVITINGTTGEVYKGEVPLIVPSLSGNLEKILTWADEIRKLGVRANADTPEQAKKAREFGAEGIGLARTEHMFFGEERLPIMQEMIIAKTKEKRIEALNKLQSMQRSDFIEFFRTMEGYPVIIRLLDPPLHEFLPNHDEIVEEINELKMKLRDAKSMKEMDDLIAKINEKKELLAIVNELHEFNPMLGFRGCRLGVIYPEIYEMQVRAIMQAAIEVKNEGKEIYPEIMIPLIGHVNELKLLKEKLEKIAREEMQKAGVEIKYMFGTMIEIPRAALTADEIAEYAEFFSFGTNDLTQMTFGYSRDDAQAKFLRKYVEMGILKEDPFKSLDWDGVGQLVKMGTEKGRSSNPKLEVGVCGEHGGDPHSIEFFHMAGLNYVSCSPFRVPIARLAAAQAQLKHPRE
ncbi:MAG: pyruvate, phosphate dikinase [Euryarchaeota archaeon]|nr:pyruvate, phosphate dikinase [Euryarchaeota archaeon]